MKAIFTLTSAESKRLIAQGVAKLPEVKAALEDGYIYLAGGTTNAFIAEELTGVRIISKGDYTAGVITQGVHCTTDANLRMKPLVLKAGQPIEMSMTEVLEVFTGKDVFIKGGNALDPEGNVGVLVGDSWGGTIGRSLGRLIALGANLILPIGLEKMIPSVVAATNFAGIDQADYSLGMRVGLIPVCYGSVITELDALGLMADFDEVIHLSSGGIDGSEGAVTLGITGPEAEIQQVLKLIKKIKGEPTIKSNKRKCVTCRSCNFGRNEL